MGKDNRGGHKPNFSNRSLRGRPTRGGVGAKAKQKTIIEPHRFSGVFIAKTQKWIS